MRREECREHDFEGKLVNSSSNIQLKDSFQNYLSIYHSIPTQYCYLVVETLFIHEP